MAFRDVNAGEEITRILNAARAGDRSAGSELLSSFFGELRRLASAKLKREKHGHTLQATALVHEAWIRLGQQPFANRAHFFGAAAEAMRRILVDRARRRNRAKHGAGAEHCDVDELEIAAPLADDEELLKVHDALDALIVHDSRKGELVKLRYFIGLSFEEAAELLQISVATAKRDWVYARAWLQQEIAGC